MVKVCIICKAPQVRNSQLSFHRFPKNQERRKAWLNACSLKETNFKEWWLICSKHFVSDDFDTSVWPTKVLRKCAVPAPSKNYISTSSVPLAASPLPEFERSVIVSELSENKENIPVSSETDISTMSLLYSGPSCSKDEHNETSRQDASESPSRYTPYSPRYIGDLTPLHFSTPRKAKRHLDFVKDTVESQRKKIKLLHRQKKRLEQHILSTNDLLKHLCDQKLLSKNAKRFMMEETPTVLQHLLKRQLVSKNRKYLPEIRSFALTLHFYSSSAYNYVRREFNNLLPHPETIRQWYMVVEGNPGFTKEAFQAIKAKQEEGSKIIVNLVLDEISIRQLIQWQGGKYHGYADLGYELEGDGDKRPSAKCALVIMAVAVNSHWKITLGYFLIKSLNGNERANLVTTCLQLLHETGASCHSITFDGASVNISMSNVLGANYIFEDFRPWFIHINTGEKVHIIWDACHMIKLVRNALGDRQILYNSDGKKIEWRYIAMLQNIQKQEGLHAATKLTDRHINYENEKMKVKLAVQTLSASVSAAIIFCKSKNFSEFEDSEATAEFCMIMNNIFDILNSRNFRAISVYNRPLSSNNYDFLKEKILYYIDYVRKLKDNYGDPILEGNRKIGFLGIIVTLTSYLNLYEDLIITNYLKYLLSYKFSQDHLEIYFSAVRMRGGHNNNPSALQFKSAYKRLLVRHQITASKLGNCNILDATTILFVGAGTVAKTIDPINNEETINNMDTISLVDHDHDYFSFVYTLSPFVEDVVEYISGFIVKTVKNKINCSFCFSQLYGTESQSQLLKIKKRGELIIASSDVNKLCIYIEKLIRQHSSVLFTRKNINEFILLKVLKDSDIFYNEDMATHISSQDILDNHRIQLIKLLGSTYLKVRLHHEAKIKSNELHPTRIRQKCTKYILFQNE